MQLKYSLAVALLISGCQTTQRSEPHPSSSETNAAIVSPPEQIAEQAPSVQAPLLNVPLKESQIPMTAQMQENLWDRLSMQFSLPTYSTQEDVIYYRNWYLKNPLHLETVAERARPFLYLITEKVEKENLPIELALLPVVESAFDVYAYSHGSAAGLWQFLSGTGRIYGLKQDYWYDGRRDVYAATEAALDYLSYLNQLFDGNWMYAIAAYNSGEGRVMRAIKKNQNAGKPTDFFSLDLPQETSAYVPKLLALVDVIAHQKKYHLSLPAIANKPVLKRVKPNQQLDLALAAEFAGLSLKEFQELNPAFNHWATGPDGPYDLLLPIKNAEQFKVKLAANKGLGLRYARIQIKTGDSLGLLAQKYNTSTDMIKKANHLTSNLIRAGKYLIIPTPVAPEKSLAKLSSHLIKSRSTPKNESLIKTTNTNKYKISHKVKAGENLWLISKQYGVSHLALAKWNQLKTDQVLSLGKELIVWQENKNENATMRTLYYTVRNGDSLSEIAQKFNVNTQDVIKWNGLSHSKYLQPGQKITLYVDVKKNRT
jgi:membrane-bound lytic murein transglycosylase D